jgi:hypothetical protein
MPTPPSHISHLAPTVGPGGVPGSDPLQKEPDERGDGVFVCCGVYGVNAAPFGHPPQARLKKPLNRAIAALVLLPPSLFWPPSAGERASPFEP